ncbi:MAG: Gfo/Idh/MocA family oxidoreductase [Oscillospiraceae bacterium]|nr:Gfo/Idh/MocA family oxidoreductase [Oscillospiraceae bacterium]
MKKIRIGLVGCGNMMSFHMNGVNKVEGLEVVAICDTNEANMAEVAKVLDNPFCTTDYREMVDKIDAILIALPHHLHFPCGMFFARHKKHILMEKPLCNTEEECLRLIKECEDNEVVLMCGYPVRYMPGILKLKEMVDSGEYGKIMQMSVWTEQLTTCTDQDWVGTSCLGGGQLFSHGCHYIDLLLWFCGNPVSGAHFGTNVGTPWMLKEGTSAVTMSFENGAIGYHGATWGARGTRMGYDFQIMMEKGLLEYDHQTGEVKVYDKTKLHKPGELDHSAGDYELICKYEGNDGKQTQYEMSHFVDCIVNKKKPFTDGLSALKGLRVIWELYNAEKNHTLADLRGMGLSEE